MSPAYGTPTGASYASFGARLGALLLDGLITSIAYIPAIIAIFAGPKTTRTCTINANNEIDSSGQFHGLCRGPSGATIAIALLLGLAAFAAAIVYWAKTEGVTGQTIGKRALGIKTIDINTGAPIGSGRAVGRYFARILSGAICYLGYFWMLWDPKKQTWHDKIVSSAVVRA